MNRVIGERGFTKTEKQPSRKVAWVLPLVGLKSQTKELEPYLVEV